MYDYDMKALGDRIRSYRKSLSLSQKRLSELSNVSEDALRKIENGFVIPKHETLESISRVLKCDFNSYFMKIKNRYMEIIERYDLILSNLEITGHYEHLEVIENELKEIINEGDGFSEYSLLKLIQYSFLINSIYQLKYEHDFVNALELAIQGIKKSMPDFTVDSYMTFQYDYVEIRLLHIIARCYSSMGNYEVSHTIHHYVLEHSEEKFSDKFKYVYADTFLCLAEDSIQMKKFDEAASYIEKGLYLDADLKELNYIAKFYEQLIAIESKLEGEENGFSDKAFGSLSSFGKFLNKIDKQSEY